MSMMGTGFSAFDEVTGGLPSGRDYLLCGAAGTGKTSFGLGFLFQGLRASESSALITRRAPKLVLEQARTLGWDLDEYIRGGQLMVLEYPQDLQQQTSLLRDSTEVYEAFRSMLAGSSIRRLVFDPVTPLLMLPGASFPTQRVRTLMQAFAELQATTLYIIDTPEGESYVPGCKDQVFGMLRFDGRGPARVLAIERIPGVAPGTTRFPFDIRPGSGLVRCGEAEAAEPEIRARALRVPELSADPQPVPFAPVWNARLTAAGASASQVRRHAGHWLVLVAGPHAAERQALRAAVEPDVSVIEAKGPADCLRLAAAEEPDLILLSQQSRGITALELVEKLRRSDITVPVVLLGERLRRRSDRARTLEAGADLALDWPVDVRLLRLHVRQFLKRSAISMPGLRGTGAGFEVAPQPVRPTLVCTGSEDRFRERMRAEAAYARACNLPFVVAALYAPGGEDMPEELAAVCSLVSRHDDLTYCGETGVAVIMAEALEATPFLERFQQRWRSGPRPVVDCRHFDGSHTFADETVDSLVGLLGSRNGHQKTDSLVAALAERMEVASVSLERNGFHPAANGAQNDVREVKPHAAAASASDGPESSASTPR